MAVCRIYDVPGGTIEQYDRVNELLSQEPQAPGPDEAPPGAMLHVAGATEGGFQVIELWESRDHLDRFFEEWLGSAIQEAGVPQPNISEFEVHSLMWAGQGS